MSLKTPNSTSIFGGFCPQEDKGAFATTIVTITIVRRLMLAESRFSFA
jgi:hypothetical protein